MNHALEQRTLRWLRFASGLGGLWRRYPVVTICLGCVSIAATLLASELLAFDRQAAVGETWRLFTGHFVHWNADHLAWDVAMLVVLGAWIERHSRRMLILLVAITPPIISSAIWFMHPGLDTYRGLSGIDSALFVYVALLLLAETLNMRKPVAAAMIVAMVVGFATKIGWEVATGTTLFVDSTAAGFVPLPSVHAVGAAVGCAAWAAMAAIFPPTRGVLKVTS